jgi:RNA polymerase sigma factor (sigma-70 family)
MGASRPTAGRAESRSRDALVARLDARFRGPLMVYFLRRKFMRAEAEDLTQEVFLRMIGREAEVPPDNVDVYIFQVAANLLRDRARRSLTRSVGDHTSLDAPAEVTANGLDRHPGLIEDRGPERVLLAQESLAEALSALDELGERTRNIYILHRLEKMRHKEIAKVLGLSVSAVEKHVIRAVAHLAQRFGKP